MSRVMNQHQQLEDGQARAYVVAAAPQDSSSSMCMLHMRAGGGSYAAGRRLTGAGVGGAGGAEPVACARPASRRCSLSVELMNTPHT